MQNFPFATGDADVAALMALVAIVAAEIVQAARGVDADLVDGGDAEAGAGEFG